MNTLPFDREFQQLLDNLIVKEHPGLHLEIPTSGTLSGELSPDFVVSNPVNGDALVFEIKTGAQALQIPISTIPNLSSLKARLPTKNSKLVFVCSGAVPSFMADRLKNDGIEYLKADTIQDVHPWLNDKLLALEKA